MSDHPVRYVPARRLALGVSVLCGTAACGGPSFEASTLTDSGPDAPAIDAGADVYLPPIVVCSPCGTPDAGAADAATVPDAALAGDAQADATVADGAPADGTVPDGATSRDATLGEDAPSDGLDDRTLGDADLADGPLGDAALGDAPCGSLSDIHSCGSCGHDCTLLPSVSAAGLACIGGTCSYSCQTGYADCDDAGAGCPTSLSTANNCGACGATCGGATSVCSAAGGGRFACASGCAPGESLCGSTCANLSSESAHCGTCDHACPSAQVCSGGSCVCPDNAKPDLCGAACTSLQSDGSNCGTCGHDCLGGACSGGTCQPFVIATMPLGGPLLLDPNYLFATDGNRHVLEISKTGTLLAATGTNVGPGFAQDTASVYYVDVGGATSNFIRVMKSALALQSIIASFHVGGSLNGLAVVGSHTYFLEFDPPASSFIGDVVLGSSSLAASDGVWMVGDANGLVWTQRTGALVASTASDTMLASPIPLSIPAGASVGGLILDAANAYWFNGTDQIVYRSPRSGSANTPVTARLARGPGFAVDANFLYMADSIDATISRVPLAGTASTPTILVTGQNGASAIAADAVGTPQAALYWINGSTLTKLANPP